MPPKGYPRPTAQIRWPVEVIKDKVSVDGVTLNLSPDGVFIRCPLPFGLNEVFEMVITPPTEQPPIRATAEVVWSNRYGPDDEITPRGMGAKFVRISDEDSRFLTKVILEYIRLLDSDPRSPTRMETLLIEPG